MKTQRPKRVVIIDDSALVRQLLREMIDSSPDLEVVGTATDPIMARKVIKQVDPDVLTLDVEMPKMDGLAFLENLMRLRPMPVVMVSALTQKGAETTLEALRLGAVDCIAKPQGDLAAHFDQTRDTLVEKLVAAADANVRPTPLEAAPAPLPALGGNVQRHDVEVIALGASTGGTEAVRAVIERLPTDLPPIVIVQHIPENFSQRFADRLDSVCALDVHHAAHGQLLEDGHAYVAPGDEHLRVVRRAGRLHASLDKSAPIHRHRPSVDVLFDSVLEAVGGRSLALLLTGMGEDGAAAMKRLREAGACTLAQDEASSVVWGMPGAAHRMGAACELVALRDAADRILNGLRRRTTATQP